MSARRTRSLLLPAILLAAAVPSAAGAQEPDPDAPAAGESGVRTELQDKPPAPPPPGQPQGQQPAGQQSPVEPRDALRNEQQPAPRPGNLTLDPKYLGFLQVPNTPVMIKLNAKPRADLTVDVRNAGDDNRFITARIPT